MLSTTTPSTRNAAPVVAEDGRCRGFPLPRRCGQRGTGSICDRWWRRSGKSWRSRI